MTNERLEELQTKANNQDAEAIKELVVYYNEIGDTEMAESYQALLPEKIVQEESEVAPEEQPVIQSDITVDDIYEAPTNVSEFYSYEKIKEYKDCSHEELWDKTRKRDLNAMLTAQLCDRKIYKEEYKRDIDEIILKQMDSQIAKIKQMIISDTSLSYKLKEMLKIKCQFIIKEYFHDNNKQYLAYDRSKKDAKGNIETFKGKYYDLKELALTRCLKLIDDLHEYVLNLEKSLAELSELDSTDKETIWLRHWFSLCCNQEPDTTSWHSLLKQYGIKGVATYCSFKEFQNIEGLETLIKTEDDQLIYDTFHGNIDSFKKWLLNQDYNTIVALFKNEKENWLENLFNIENMDGLFDSPFASLEHYDLVKLIGFVEELDDNMSEYMNSSGTSDGKYVSQDIKHKFAYINIIRFLRSENSKAYEQMKANTNLKTTTDWYIHEIVKILEGDEEFKIDKNVISKIRDLNNHLYEHPENKDKEKCYSEANSFVEIVQCEIKHEEEYKTTNKQELYIRILNIIGILLIVILILYLVLLPYISSITNS